MCIYLQSPVPSGSPVPMRGLIELPKIPSSFKFSLDDLLAEETDKVCDELPFFSQCGQNCPENTWEKTNQSSGEW